PYLATISLTLAWAISTFRLADSIFRLPDSLCATTRSWARFTSCSKTSTFGLALSKEVAIWRPILRPVVPACPSTPRNIRPTDFEMELVSTANVTYALASSTAIGLPPRVKKKPPQKMEQLQHNKETGTTSR